MSFTVPVEIEALYSRHHMVIAGSSVVEVTSERVLPAASQCLTVDKGGVGPCAAVRLPQAVIL